MQRTLGIDNTGHHNVYRHLASGFRSYAGLIHDDLLDVIARHVLGDVECERGFTRQTAAARSRRREPNALNIAESLQIFTRKTLIICGYWRRERTSNKSVKIGS
jgi:hypothetical protein